MTHGKYKATWILLSMLGLCQIGYGGKIVYPWNAVTAMVKTGESFDVWFDADAGQSVQSVELLGPYHTVTLPAPAVQAGSWIYDRVSSNRYDTLVSVTVPPDTPEDRYDLVLKTSSGREISRKAVKVVREYLPDFTVMHLSDTHMCQGAKTNGHPERLFKISALAEIANIIGPELVFVTGDVINNRMFPPEVRSEFFYDGCADRHLKGMHGFDAATFTAAGNHDFPEGELPAEGSYREKADFWNRYHGLQSHHFTYGYVRCMIVNDGWEGFDWTYQLAEHAAWLDATGPGRLRIAAYHKSEMGIMGAWANEIGLGLAMIGHNHHLAFDNPYELDGRPIQYYADSVREHLVFNLFRIESNGTYTAVNNVEAVENPEDPPAAWRPRLTLAYARANDGTSGENTATLVNNFSVGFPRARVRFVVPKGDTYAVSGGTVEQAFDGDSVHVVDVRISVDAISAASVEIKPIKIR